MAFVEDTTFFLTDFGIAATVGGVFLRGIFDNASADAFGIAAETSPTLLVLADDAPTAAVGDAVTIGSDAYTVASLQADGTGLLRLVLK